MPLLQEPHKALLLEALQGHSAVQDLKDVGVLLDLLKGRAAHVPIASIDVI